MLEIWKHYPTVVPKLQAVTQLISERLQSDNTDIQELLNACANDQGKMLRPGLFLLFAELGEHPSQDNEQLIKVAATLEILHKATLIHDDIIDDSPLRHGEITIQSKYGKDVAVYAGDLLFTVFFELLSETMNGTSLMHYNATAMQKLLIGELSQMHARYFRAQTITDYLHNVKGKTAELFKLACLEGAYFSKQSPEIQEIAAQIGENIGIAFQIFDDILDYTSTSGTLKKPVLEDLAEGVYTSPLLFSYAEHPQDFDNLLQKERQVTAVEVKKVGQLVRKYGGVQKATQLAHNYTKRALLLITELPASPAQKQIKKITEIMSKRSF
ncbi:polyprenyl synthetase family protein [Liquorilactobacillus oeni]|uniref:Polyprenyl diphosphate synthase n=1 Tax=Liquorilactobacillus oeni DSM 19972 TaxID=1423777 RepID=A0A0R1MKS6_9LACO|nr:polyprenyl synthetase family protein [Liquorilactobacillus oeni]KRL05938.1 polyprenyl diphosphate synthase [Liquorilactobacillus oeni DSM 19972]